uniref:Uncharacterized protein n=1 Tax=Heterosigma akashiwo TaxID=2829 RepID=A0A7S3XZY2_HETAK
MVDLTKLRGKGKVPRHCQATGCSCKNPSYGFVDGKRTHCAKHKEPGMFCHTWKNTHSIQGSLLIPGGSSSLPGTVKATPQPLMATLSESKAPDTGEETPLPLMTILSKSKNHHTESMTLFDSPFSQDGVIASDRSAVLSSPIASKNPAVGNAAYAFVKTMADMVLGKQLILTMQHAQNLYILKRQEHECPIIKADPTHLARWVLDTMHSRGLRVLKLGPQYGGSVFYSANMDVDSFGNGLAKILFREWDRSRSGTHKPPRETPEDDVHKVNI